MLQPEQLNLWPCSWHPPTLAVVPVVSTMYGRAGTQMGSGQLQQQGTPGAEFLNLDNIRGLRPSVSACGTFRGLRKS